MISIPATISLLALLAVPAVVVLHLFRRRHRPRVVSAVFLWREPGRAPAAGRKLDRLRRSASLLLEAAAAALLALAFAGLTFPGAGDPRHLVAVLDASASMSARGADGPSAAARAADLVRERVAALPSGSRVTLIESGPRAKILSGPAAFPADAVSALARYDPRDASHDLTPALALALEISREGRVLLLTDLFEPDALPPEVEVLSVGEPARNVAIASAERARGGEGEKERARLAVRSYSDETERRTLSVRAAGETVLERAIEIEPSGRTALAFDLPPGSPAIEVALDSDALAIDDRALLVPEPRRTLRVASTLPEETSRALALAGPRGGIGRLLALVPDSEESPPGAAHFLLAPRPPDSGAALVLSIESADGERRDFAPPFLTDKRHPLLDGVTLDGVVWSVSTAVSLGGLPLVSAGNEPIMTEGDAGGRRVFRLNLDPARSNLARSPDWPILLLNAAEMKRRELPGPARANLVSGEPLVYRGEDEAAFVLAREPGEDEREVPARGGVLVVDDPGPPGLVRLSARGKALAEFAIRFADPAESDLRGRRPGRREARAALLEIDAEESRSAAGLLLAALLLALVDWFVLARRREP